MVEAGTSTETYNTTKRPPCLTNMSSANDRSTGRHPRRAYVHQDDGGIDTDLTGSALPPNPTDSRRTRAYSYSQQPASRSRQNSFGYPNRHSRSNSGSNSGGNTGQSTPSAAPLDPSRLHPQYPRRQSFPIRPSNSSGDSRSSPSSRRNSGPRTAWWYMTCHGKGSKDEYYIELPEGCTAQGAVEISGLAVVGTDRTYEVKAGQHRPTTQTLIHAACGVCVRVKVVG